MTFKEAYESGKEFKRKDWGEWTDGRHYVACFDDLDTVYLLEDMLATDWETKPEKKIYKCWVNFYKDGSKRIFNTKEDADKAALTIDINNYIIKRLNNAVEVIIEVGE